MKTIILIGGAGYLGLHLTDYLLKNTDYSIIIISRNQGKRLLVRDKRVTFLNCITDVKVKGTVINLAFENSANYTSLRNSNSNLFNRIKSYNEAVGIQYFIQLSTVALSEMNIKYGKQSNVNPYLYCKSWQEKLSFKLIKNSKICIVRAGNILGNDSPWIAKIGDKIYGHAPLVSSEHSGSSNATHIDFLCRKLVGLVESEQQGQFNCCELSDISWNKIIQELHKSIKGAKLCYFDDSVDKKRSFFAYLKISFLAFIIKLQASPEYASFFNKLVSFGPLSILKERVRKSEKFQLPSSPVSDMLAKEYKLFCKSAHVDSDFYRDYDENNLLKELAKGLNNMGYK